MFEVTGNDIANLGDADLRELVKKLAVAELRGQGCPKSIQQPDFAETENGSKFSNCADSVSTICG